MFRKTILIAGAALVAISTAAYASVTFDPATGTGFVGKGDVQYTYGWNNATLQSNARAVTFAFKETVAYDVTCEWDTVTSGKVKQIIHHAVTNERSTSVNAAVNADPRQTKGQNQFTGFNLTGLGAVTTTGDAIPAVGASCPMGAGTAVVTEVAPADDNVPGALYVTWNADTRLLVSPPVVVPTI